MINCSEVKNVLADYRDGVQALPNRDSITLHLEQCAACAKELASLDAMMASVFPPAERAAPPFLWTRIQASIKAEEERRGLPWWAQWRWMARVTIAATLLFGGGSAYLLHQSRLPLEVALQGRSVHQRAIQLASTPWRSRDQAAVQLVLGDESWLQK